MLNGDGDKSFVDDLVASRYCKCESSLCCYEALRFILRFYDLFFSVLIKKITDVFSIKKYTYLAGKGCALRAHRCIRTVEKGCVLFGENQPSD